MKKIYRKLSKEKFVFLYSILKNEKSLLNILFDKEISKLFKKDKILNNYLNELVKFINNEIDLEKIEKEDLIKILNIFFNILLVYYKFLSINKFVAESSKKKFILSHVRILEFAFFVALKRNKIAKQFFLDNYILDKNKQYFFYLKNLDENIKINYFAICKDKKTKQNRIIVGFNKEDCKKYSENNDTSEIIFNSFKSSIKTQSFENIDINDFDHYFHFNDKTIKKFYNYQKIKKITRIDGIGGHKEVDRKEFVIIEQNQIDDVSFVNNEDIKDSAEEVKIEVKARDPKKIMSPILDKNAAKLINSKVLENPKIELDSKYKRYLIGKAISNAIAQKNLNLLNYKIPEIEILKDFFIFLYKKDKLKADMILLQILLNANLNKLINGFINKNIIFKDQKLYIEYGNFFSTLKGEVEIFEKTQKTNRKFYIYISKIMSLILEDFQKNILKKLDNSKNILNEISVLENELNEFLKQTQKEFNKKIILNMKTLPTLSFFYFKIFKKSLFINMLFTKNIDKNDEARLCYCATTQRLEIYESWILELIDRLEISRIRFKNNISNTTTNSFKIETKIGSNKLLKIGYFKNFLLNLEKLFYENDLTKEDKLNIQMVYLRYVLGLLLATRDFYNSCNLSNYSKKFKILVLQEKAKNIYMSKRIIPLSKKAIEYIEIFEKIKQQSNIKSDSPILLINKQEKVITKPELQNFFSKFKKYSYVEEILYFINYCRLNFGRHIVTYYFANDYIKDDYLDAFLGHFKMGSEDQGIYSHFYNKDYINVVISKLEDIEQDYLINDNIFE